MSSALWVLDYPAFINPLFPAVIHQKMWFLPPGELRFSFDVPRLIYWRCCFSVIVLCSLSPSPEVSSLSPCIWAEGQQCLIAQAKDSEVILTPPSHNPVLVLSFYWPPSSLAPSSRASSGRPPQLSLSLLHAILHTAASAGFLHAHLKCMS